MKARSRKKKIYQRSFSKIGKNMLRPGEKVASYLKAWSLIKHDVLRVFGNDYSLSWDWFVAPAPALDGERPVDLARTGNARRVQELLVKLEYCVYN
jgi:uncharacterized protein (DUF2384 family)